MTVETAVYYPKNKQVTKEKLIKIWELVNIEESFVKEVNTEEGTEIEYDGRPREWTGIPLKNIIKPLREKREKLKQQIKNNINVKQNNALQEQYKLILNSIYGVLASPYFEIGNTVLSNNITARARLQIWMASRSLNGIQCITDGFQYQPNNIYEIKEKNDGMIRLPGLKTLSDLKNLQNHRSIIKTTLGKKDWTDYFQTQNDDENLNKLAEEHLKNFWNNYNLKLMYKLEHKQENSAKEMFYIKKAHYSQRLRNDTINHKYRGITHNQKETPQYMEIGESILFNRKRNIKTLEYETTKLAKINDYFIEKNKGIYLLPGYPIKKIFNFSITIDDLPSINLSHHKAKKREKTDTAKEFLTEKSSGDIITQHIEIYKKTREKYKK